MNDDGYRRCESGLFVPPATSFLRFDLPVISGFVVVLMTVLL